MLRECRSLKGIGGAGRGLTLAEAHRRVQINQFLLDVFYFIREMRNYFLRDEAFLSID